MSNEKTFNLTRERRLFTGKHYALIIAILIYYTTIVLQSPPFIIFITSLVTLIFCSEILVDCAIDISTYLGIATSIVGMIMTIGGSIPEILTSVFSLGSSEPTFATMNIMGSIFVQITLVLGIVTLIYPTRIKRDAVLRDGMIYLFVLFMLYLFLADNVFTRVESIVCMVAVIIYIILNLKSANNVFIEEKRQEKPKAEGKQAVPLLFSSFFFITCLSQFFIVPQTLVESIISFTSDFNINLESFGFLFIGLLVTLPELFIALFTMKQGKKGMAIGSLIAASLIDVGFSLSLPFIIFGDMVLGDFITVFLIPVLLISSIILILFMRTRWAIHRIEGLILIVIYVIVFTYYSFTIFMG